MNIKLILSYELKSILKLMHTYTKDYSPFDEQCPVFRNVLIALNTQTWNKQGL